MLFNSLDFAIFLPIIFILYWCVTNKNLKSQNIFIVLASYVFYGWWDWRFLSLILISTLVDYSIGKLLAQTNKKVNRKILLLISLSINLGILGFFKYYNFFIDNFTTVFSFLGKELAGNSINIILPVGISFYTFQTLSYTIDVYKGKLNPEENVFNFAAFVSFFPQLVAGPIERATHLLPQFKTKRTFNYTKAVDGLKQILWGLFKKIVIADNCAEYANYIFNNSDDLSGSTLILGALFFTFQIYGDFSGYSDIAIGTSRLFGFNLKQNFAFPYFSRDVAEFWRRWHISLSTWFRDYLYIPLGGSRGSIYKKIRNTIIVFTVSGFWHGANWTFIVWGLLNAIYFLPLLLTNSNRANLGIVAQGKYVPNAKETFKIICTFSLIVFSWIFFRAENITHAINYIKVIFSPSLFTIPDFIPSKELILILFFIIIEWIGREGKYGIETIGLKWKKPIKYAMYYVIVISILWFRGNEQEFIYFQF
ncbi:MAG: MBOAT family protein [Polaribacter sp.]